MRQLRFTKKFFLDKNNLRIISIFLVWRVGLFLFAFLGVAFIPLRGHDFFGGGMEHYSQYPLVWGWANFDGEHYLSIAKNGYGNFEYAFFPILPLVLGGFSALVHEDFTKTVILGLVFNNLIFLGSLIIFWKLVRVDFSEKIAYYSLTALLLFPTSFFFGSLYTEPIYMFLSLTAFYLARKSMNMGAGIVGAVASATRIFGILLIPAFIVEYLILRGRKKIWGLFIALLVSLGILGYMCYLYITTGDPLAFYHVLPAFGEHRQNNIVLLPQVFWRGIKIVLTINKNDIEYLTFLMELLSGILVVLALVYGIFRKFRLSYLVYLFLSLIVSTITGSFSGLPRYMLVFFPFFMIVGFFLEKRGRLFRVGIYGLSVLLLAINTALFIRGYWVE